MANWLAGVLVTIVMCTNIICLSYGSQYFLGFISVDRMF